MAFKEPDQKTIDRLTPAKLRNLITSLKERRAAAMAPHNKEIEFYENLLKKKEAADAEGSSGVQSPPAL